MSARGKPFGVFLSQEPGAASAPPRWEAQPKRQGPRILRTTAVQFSWGPHVRNPWAERKAAEPNETPAWIGTLLGAIDPILREDGGVWTDPTPRQASYRWFCIGKPDPHDPGMILLDSGGRLPVGTHLWEHGTSQRINDGTKVAEIPLTARMHKAVLDYVDGLLRHDPDPKLCEGKIDPIPQGIGAGWASVVANDDFGGRAAVLGMQLYREVTCNPEAQSSMQILSLLGKGRRQGAAAREAERERRPFCAAPRQAEEWRRRQRRRS